MFYFIAYILTFLPLRFLFPTKVLGKKNLVKKGRVILCCNHQSNSDLLILGTYLRRKYKYMAKESLFQKKFFAGIIKSLGAYPVKRGTTDIVAIKKTLTYLKNDEAVCIFPEGARLKSSETNEMKNGVIVFALKTKSPIQPAFILKKPKAFKRNILIVGEPFNLSEMEEFKDKKIDDDLIAKGKKILTQKMYGLRNIYVPKTKISKQK